LEWKSDRPAINARRSPILQTGVRAPIDRTKENRPRALRAEFGLHPIWRRRENAAAVVLQPLQGVARGLMPIDWAAIWYQLVDLKTVTRRAALRLRLAFALTCDPWRTEERALLRAFCAPVRLAARLTRSPLRISHLPALGQLDWRRSLLRRLRGMRTNHSVALWSIPD
jgi:hypothetical protein